MQTENSNEERQLVAVPSDCYSIVVSQSATEDAVTHGWSAFNIADLIKVGADGLGKVLPLEVLSFWHFDSGFLGRTLRFRISIEDINTGASEFSKHFDALVNNERLRIRVQGVKMPDVHSKFKISMQWALLGAVVAEEFPREGTKISRAFWLLTLEAP